MIITESIKHNIQHVVAYSCIVHLGIKLCIILV